VHNNIDVIFLGFTTSPILTQLKHLFSKLPKFSHSTPIPYTKSELYKLHEDNLKHINNYIFRNHIPVPSEISHFTLHRSKPPLPAQDIVQHLPATSPWKQLKNFLQMHDLVLSPADKTSHFVIWPLATYINEFNIHMQDHTTYLPISQQRAMAIQRVTQRVVRSASIYFKKPSLINSSPSPRYFFLLPKLHKPLNTWRTPLLHPKARPIICDTGSASFNLSKERLPFTQKLETSLTTVTNSSLSLLHYFEHNQTFSSTLNSFLSNTSKSKLLQSTCDVESLFTKTL
jgi:hypothetical protein